MEAQSRSLNNYKALSSVSCGLIAGFRRSTFAVGERSRSIYCIDVVIALRYVMLGGQCALTRSTDRVYVARQTLWQMMAIRREQAMHGFSCCSKGDWMSFTLELQHGPCITLSSTMSVTNDEPVWCLELSSRLDSAARGKENSRNLYTSPLFNAPCRGWTRLNFAKVFSTGIERFGYHTRKKVWWSVKPFDTIPERGRQMDGHTEGWTEWIAVNIALCRREMNTY